MRLPRTKSFHLALAGGGIVLFACSPSQRQEPELQVESEPEASASALSAAEQLAAFDAAKQNDPSGADLALDIENMLKAQVLEEQQDYTAAAQRWYAAMATARGRFAKRAFDGWVKAYCQGLGKKSDPLVLARLLLAESRQGGASAYMTSKSLTTDQALAPLLVKLVPEWLTVEQGSKTAAIEISPPKDAGVPSDDPLLVDTARRQCQAAGLGVSSWQKWINSLPAEVAIYWQGLVAHCAGQSTRAMELFKEAYPKLGRKTATQAMAIEAAARTAILQRANDQKTAAADTYTDLMDLWAKPGATANAFALDRLPFLQRRIDETLWAARYRTTVADYENGKRHAQAALELVSTAMQEREAQVGPRREELAALRADAYHILAYRIAVEKREFDSALALNTLALENKDLNREWQERLTWFSGLYEYLLGNFEAAQKRWLRLHASTNDDSMKTATLFWSARAIHKLGRSNDAAALVERLVTDYPLSYYSVVAVPAAELPSRSSWQNALGNLREAEAKLASQGLKGIARYREHHQVGSYLRRAEFLSASKLDHFAKLASQEAHDVMTTHLDHGRDSDAFLYLTRLQYNNGQFLAAIALTTKLAKTSSAFWREHPEQLTIYFPRPYQSAYVQYAQDSGLDRALLLAISRQESGFTPEIRSSANAIGVMQLILPTAQTFSQGLDLGGQDLEKALENPPTNIRIGARFLKHLSLRFKGYSPAIFGGYNAGEYAMKTWLERRAHQDTLAFVELVPFGETKDYIKNVWRNMHIYRAIETEKTAASQVWPKHRRYADGRAQADWR